MTVSVVAAFVAVREYRMESATPLCKKRAAGLYWRPSALFLSSGGAFSIPYSSSATNAAVEEVVSLGGWYVRTSRL